MKLFRIALLLVVVMVLLAASSGPDSRTPTDPKSVTSEQNANAKPVTIEDLFETRSVNGGSWSPDGKSVIFEQDHGGNEMYDLYSVPAGGGDPQNLTNTDQISEENALFSHNGKLRSDGLMVHDLVLVQVKKPEESRYPWDYYQVLAHIPGEQAFGPPDPACALAKN